MSVESWSVHQGLGWSVGYPPDSSIRLPPGHSGPAARFDTTLLLLDDSDCAISIRPFSNVGRLAAADYVDHVVELAQAEAQISGLPNLVVESSRTIPLEDHEAHELRYASPGGVEIATYVALDDIGLAIQAHCVEPADGDAALAIARGVAATARRSP
jgi:hypothetical protein